MAQALAGVDWARMLDRFNLWALLALAGCVALAALWRRPAKAGLLARLEALTPKQELAAVALLTLLAGAVRLFRLGASPAGFNVDEASIAYDAWCMAEYGTDRHGVVNPAYLISWGSGQDVLYAWLLIPLYKLFGFSVFVTRLPQAVLGTLAVPMLYLLLRKVCALAGGPPAQGENHHVTLTALLGAALLATSPWHVMASRWALIVYPLVGLLCAGLWCFLAAEKRPPLYLAAFVCWALCLYAYLTSALFLLPFLALLFAYFLYHKRISFKWFFIGAAAGLVVAFPILWFVLANNGLVPEIRTPLFSVVKLFIYRQDEVAGDVYRNAKAIWELFAWQRPDWNNSFYDSVDIYGIVYLFSTPFALVGGFAVGRRVWRAARQRRFTYEAVWVFWLVAAVFASVMIHPNTFNRCIPLVMIYIILCAFGLRAAVLRLPALRWPVVAAYAAAFALFLLSYFFTYAPDIGRAYNAGLMEAYALADEVAAGRDILVPGNVGFFGAQSTYPYVCLNRRLPPEDFQAGYNREPRAEYPGATHLQNVYFLPEGFGGAVAPHGEAAVYLLDNLTDPVWDYEAAGFTVEVGQHYTVAWMDG